MYLRFAFEGDLHRTLEFIPLSVRRKLDLDDYKLPLAKVLEGGSWAAGRALANQHRNGLPPLNVKRAEMDEAGGILQRVLDEHRSS